LKQTAPYAQFGENSEDLKTYPANWTTSFRLGSWLTVDLQRL